MIPTNNLRATQFDPATRSKISLGQTPSIRAEALSHYFGSGELRKQVLFENHLTVYPGEIIIMTGPSGSGKTTLLTLLGALRSVQQGNLEVLGQPLDGASPKAMEQFRRQVGFIFQAHNLFDSLNATQNVRMAIELCYPHRSAQEQTLAAEEISFGQFDDLDFGDPFSDCNFALADQVEAIAGVTLADDLVTWSVVFDVEFVGYAGEGSWGDAIEDFAFREHLGDDCCFFDQCIATDRAIDEGQDTVGHVEDTVIVGDDDDGGLFFAGEFLEQFDDGPPALFIEGGRRFVGQDQSWLVD